MTNTTKTTKYVVVPEGALSSTAHLYELDEAKSNPGAPKYNEIAKGNFRKIDELCAKLNGVAPAPAAIIFQGKPLSKEQINAIIEIVHQTLKDAGVFA